MSKTKLSAKLRIEIIERDGRKCLWCGRGPQDGVKLHVDHVLPESFGGSSSSDNLGTLCDQCNLGKSDEYFGQYLLSTLLELRNIDTFVSDQDTGQRIHPDTGKIYDGFFNKLSIGFYKIDANNVFRAVDVHYFYLIPEILRISTGSDTEIHLLLLKQKARLNFMLKLRDYFFDNKGYLKKLGPYLLFKSRQ